MYQWFEDWKSHPMNICILFSLVSLVPFWADDIQSDTRFFFIFFFFHERAVNQIFQHDAWFPGKASQCLFLSGERKINMSLKTAGNPLPPFSFYPTWVAKSSRVTSAQLLHSLVAP